jgi:signal transduction histidine kinase
VIDANDKVSILLVDDQPARLLTYETILADLGLDLVCARSGFEALERLMKQEFAVVLLDVSMPDMDGFEAAGLIHEHPRLEKTPIIFVTGVHISELDRLRGYKLGAVDYVSIPVVPEILRSKVSVLVELYNKRRELKEANRTLAEVNQALAAANVTLQAEKSRELEALNGTLSQANAELASTNRSLQTEIAERARVELALKEADRNKDEFLAMLAHELRNPLAPIYNAVQLMRRKRFDDPQLAWSRDVIERQVAHLSRLVDDLLDVSRITRGKINLTKESLDVNSLIARAVETTHPLIAERAHDLVVEVPDEPVKVLGDPTRLTQALGNVLSNAAKYTDRGGRIAIAVRLDGAEVAIRVRDTGEGIPADLLPVIFNLFTQLDRTSGHAQGGLGIGLALVRRLVEMHGGSVTAHSDGVGKGSEFVIRLPVHVEIETSTNGASVGLQPVGAAASVPAEGPIPVLNGAFQSSTLEPPADLGDPVKRRILLADDNSDALESLATLLELGGHEVVTASNGALALECAERHRPEVVLLDIGMPMLDGYEVARRIRVQPWGQKITLVALTGWGQDSDRRRSREAGFDSHLVKPLDMDKLTELLEKLPPSPQAAVPGA